MLPQPARKLYREIARAFTVSTRFDLPHLGEDICTMLANNVNRVTKIRVEQSSIHKAWKLSLAGIHIPISGPASTN